MYGYYWVIWNRRTYGATICTAGGVRGNPSSCQNRGLVNNEDYSSVNENGKGAKNEITYFGYSGSLFHGRPCPFCRRHERDEGMQGDMKSPMMRQMMSNPHHKLGMTYMKNVRNFAEALKSEVTSTGKVDKDFATTAVTEMKQSLQQMQKHHEEMQKSVSEEMKGKMGEMVKMMDNRLSMTQQHLNSLEKEVKADMPDPKKVAT